MLSQSLYRRLPVNCGRNTHSSTSIFIMMAGSKSVKLEPPWRRVMQLVERLAGRFCTPARAAAAIARGGRARRGRDCARGKKAGPDREGRLSLAAWGHCSEGLSSFRGAISLSLALSLPSFPLSLSLTVSFPFFPGLSLCLSLSQSLSLSNLSTSTMRQETWVPEHSSRGQ